MQGGSDNESADQRKKREMKEELAAEKEGVKAMAKRRFLVRLALLFVYTAWAIMTVSALSALGL